jgi:hypothetical protein
VEWRIKLEATSGWGEVKTIEVAHFTWCIVGLTAEEVNLEEAKQILTDLQRSLRRTWRGLCLCVHDNLSVGRSTRMIVRIYTGHDGQTHFEELPLPAEENHNVALQSGANLVFRCFPADYWSDWHTAPRRQYIFILVGQMEIGIGDGTTRCFGPGDVVLADDLTGQGHTTRSLGVPRVSATVPVGA